MKNHIALISLFLAILTAPAVDADNLSNQPPTDPSAFTIMLKDPEDIALAQAVNKALENLTVEVTACRKQNPAKAQDCVCAYPKDMTKLKSALDSAVQKHPEWKKKAVSYSDSTGSHALSVPGLERQILACK